MTSMSGGERKVYTLALNPAIDRTFWIDRLDFNESNRVKRSAIREKRDRRLTSAHQPRPAQRRQASTEGIPGRAGSAEHAKSDDRPDRVEGDPDQHLFMRPDRTSFAHHGEAAKVTSEMDTLFDKLSGLGTPASSPLAAACPGRRRHLWHIITYTRKRHHHVPRRRAGSGWASRRTGLHQAEPL